MFMRKSHFPCFPFMFTAETLQDMVCYFSSTMCQLAVYWAI